MHLAASEGLELPAGAFDAVVCVPVCPHFDHRDAALAILARWLKRGGRLLIAHWDGHEKLAAIHASHHSVAADVFPPRPHLEAAFAPHGFTRRSWIGTLEEIFTEVTR